jgi:hypothetical protein
MQEMTRHDNTKTRQDKQDKLPYVSVCLSVFLYVFMHRLILILVYLSIFSSVATRLFSFLLFSSRFFFVFVFTFLSLVLVFALLFLFLFLLSCLCLCPGLSCMCVWRGGLAEKRLAEEIDRKRDGDRKSITKSETSEGGCGVVWCGLVMVCFILYFILLCFCFVLCGHCLLPPSEFSDTYAAGVKNHMVFMRCWNILAILLGTASVLSQDVCSVVGNADAACSQPPHLIPSDIKKPSIYTAWVNTTIELLPGQQMTVAKGGISSPSPLNVTTTFAVLQNIMSAEEVTAALALVKGPAFDLILDNVDRMPAQHLYLYNSASAEDATLQAMNEEYSVAHARHPVLSCLVLAGFVLSCLILPCHILPCVVLCCVVSCCVVLCCVVSSCLVLPCLVLSYLI